MVDWQERARKFLECFSSSNIDCLQIGQIGGPYDLNYFRNCKHLLHRVWPQFSCIGLWVWSS